VLELDLAVSGFSDTSELPLTQSQWWARVRLR